MADLVIRYVNGRRTLAIDCRGRCRLEAVLHDKSRERRVPIPPEYNGVTLDQWAKALEYANEH